MPKVTVTINENVTIRLTEKGERIWRQQLKGDYLPIPSDRRVNLGLKLFMQVFGEHLDDYEPAFDTTEIVLG